ncbi:MAG TPA: M23 family metallopeptidase [Pedococcus sp.]
MVRPFLPPASAWGPGHRGVDLAAAVAQPVLAAAEGRVTHVGVVAGRPTLTVTHAGGVRTTYEPVDPAVRRGEHVAQGQVVGHLASVPGHCAPTTCLHLGALRGRTYLDPLSLLLQRPVRLLPSG